MKYRKTEIVQIYMSAGHNNSFFGSTVNVTIIGHINIIDRNLFCKLNNL